jgi:hypothetical protein
MGEIKMYEVITEYDNQGPVVVMRSKDLGKCLDKQKRLIQDGHLDCFISRGKPGFPGPLDPFEAKVKA